jgi:hypothetical protein
MQLRTSAVDTHAMKILALAYEDRLIETMICGTVLCVHTTYTLCGWARSEASKCGTKMVGGSSIGAGEEVLTLSSPRRKGGFTVPGRPLARGCAQDRGY